MTNRTYVNLLMDDRVVNFGAVPRTKIKEFFKNRYESRLWKEIGWYMRETYPNSKLEEVEIWGDTSEKRCLFVN